jgi:hypothetical protein
MLVKVYRNLNRHCWSVMDARSRRVIAHRDTLALDACAFRVSEAGRQRVLREGRRNVHAFVVGTLRADPAPLGRRVAYNPRRCGGFVDVETGRIVLGAAVVSFAADGSAWAAGLKYAPILAAA